MNTRRCNGAELTLLLKKLRMRLPVMNAERRNRILPEHTVDIPVSHAEPKKMRIITAQNVIARAAARRIKYVG